MQASWPRVGRRLLFTLLALATCGWALAYLTWPYQADHGAYAWIARTILHGGMPYVDAWDVKGPAASLPFVASALLLGHGTWAIRLLDLLLVLATGWAVGRVVRPHAGGAAAVVAAVVWIFSYASLGFTNTAQPDGWVAMGLFLVLAPALGARVPGRAPALGIAAIAGVATLVKPFYLLYGILALLLAWGAREHRSRRIAEVAVAFGLPIALILAWFAARGALHAMVDAYLGFNLAKNSGGLLSVMLAAISYGVLADPVITILLPLAAAGIAALTAAGQRRSAVLLLASLGIGLTCVVIQRPYYAYRILVVYPPMIAAAACVGLVREPAGLATRTLRTAWLAGAALVLLYSAREPLAAGVRGARLAAGRISRAQYDRLFAFHGTTAADEKRVAAWIDAHSSPTDSIFVWAQLGVLSYARRDGASRLLLPVTTEDGAPSPWKERFLAEIDRDLATLPRWLVLERDQRSHAQLDSFGPIRTLPSRGRALVAHYQPVFESGTLVVFQRR